MGNESFPAWLRRQIDRQEWRPADFARKGKFTPGMVSGWLNGQKKPSPASVDRIAEVLGADVDMLLALAGHRPATEPLDPDDPRNELIGMIKRIEFAPANLRSIRAQLEILLDEQKERRKGKAK